MNTPPVLHDFQKQLVDSQEQELEQILRAEVYPRIFPGMDGLATIRDLSTQRTGRDLRISIAKPGGTRIESVEEKIRSPKCWGYTDLLIETISNEEQNTAGWGITSEADWLAYVWEKLPRLRVLILPLPDLQRWFRLRHINYEERRAHTFLQGGGWYTTVNRVVPWNDEYFRAFRKAHGSFAAVRDVNGLWRP